MQENWQQLISAFDENQNYVLATIVATRGSTYRKTGTMMLISSTGVCIGLLSGGCLEADISLHAEQVIKSKTNQLLTYDLKADAELLWGLGLGCDGAIDILLQPLLVENNHLAFGAMISAVKNRKSGFYCQLIKDDVLALSYFIVGDIQDQTSLNKEIQQRVIDKLITNENELLITPIIPPFSLLICGAGPDVVPLVILAAQQGWQLTLWDHRPAYLEQSEFSVCAVRTKVRAENVAEKAMADFDGVVIMSHNLTNDGFFLKHALADSVNYIGLLGPVGRRDKLLKELSLTASDVKNQVYGPVGLDLGGRSPQAIALSICAEIQQHISQKFESKHYKSWLLDQKRAK